MPRFQLHQRVRIARLLSEHTNDLASAERTPAEGEIGAIVHVYSVPHEAYCVECVKDGETLWLSDFVPDELEIA